MTNEALDLGTEVAVRRLGHKYTGESVGDYYYSLNGEDYEGDGQSTRDGAIAEARDRLTDDHEDDEYHGGIWTGRGVRRTCAALADGDSVCSQIVDGLLERMRENAYEWVGDHADGFLDEISRGSFSRNEADRAQVDELRYTLMRAIDQWADRHDLQPRFFGIVETEET